MLLVYCGTLNDGRHEYSLIAVHPSANPDNGAFRITEPFY